MNVARRSKDLRARLLDLRIGPGAAIFSNDVKRIDLNFAFKYNDGQFGARKLWRNYFPRLKYYNPAVSMTVNRHHDYQGPSTLTVHFRESSVPVSPDASDQRELERTELIDMKHKPALDILEQLIELTAAVPYQPSIEETTELEEVAEDRKKRDKARERQQRINERQRHEKALLQQARETIS